MIDEVGAGDIARRHGFTLEAASELGEIDGQAYVMRHAVSGARLLYLKNDDSNKAFSIAFKTPASDDTGVFHILEHSVLCGSRKFPVKEPFVNLLKSSMQTFLNAMTFPDKTMYPVASTNEQDLENLMDVYLDAVFHPAIYEKRAIFEQEGWHLELAGEEGGAPRELTCNGVVFNEMKGALADPDSVLYNAVSEALFPDTTYRFESGGVPDSIPDLTYEAFLDTHRRHYRPDNSYIVLYGDLDIDRFLGFIDERYLTPVAAELAGEERGAVNPLDVQEPVVARGVVREMSTTPDNACCGLGFVLGTASQRERMIAVDILLDAVMGSNEAPLKRALLDAGIASDAFAYLADAVAQPFALIGLKGVKPGCAPRLLEIVRAQARRLADGGLDRALVDAALSHAEFVMRERNFGTADGVVMAMSSLAGWLYDEDAAVSYLRYEDAFARLRIALDEGYFEKLIAEVFLDNDHFAEVEVRPTEGREEGPLARRLAARAASLDDEQAERIERAVAALRAQQEAPDAPEDVAKLPRLRTSDIGPAPELREAVREKVALPDGSSALCLRHDVPAHGIVYTYRYYDLSCLDFEDLPYVTVLALVLGKLSTAKRSAADLDTAVQAKLGNLSFFAEVHENGDDRERVMPKFVVSASALAENVAFAATLADEVLLTTDFSDHAKVYDVLMQKRIAFEQNCVNAGHGAALSRVASYYLPAAVVRQKLSGMDFYAFLRDLTDDFARRADALEGKLRDVARTVFTSAACVLSFTGSDEDLACYLAALDPRALPEKTAAQGVLRVPEPVNRREAFAVSSDVSFTAVGYDRRLLGAEHAGSLLLLSRILSFDYLWNEIRVKGGAYGAGFQVTRAGSMRFYTYRDPRIDESIGRMAAAGRWIESFAPDEAEMEGFVVSAVAGLDAPLKARDLVRRQDGMYFGEYASEQRAKLRAQVVEAQAQDIRALGPLVERVVDSGCVCVVGGRKLIDSMEEDLHVVDLFGVGACEASDCEERAEVG